MARNRVIIETITCDVCGKELDNAVTKRVGLDRSTWLLDLCDDDANAVERQINTWVANARKADTPARSNARQSKDDWEYLEALGFTRHRGRKTPAEVAALANRR